MAQHHLGRPKHAAPSSVASYTVGIDPKEVPTVCHPKQAGFVAPTGREVVDRIVGSA